MPPATVGDVGQVKCPSARKSNLHLRGTERALRETGEIGEPAAPKSSRNTPHYIIRVVSFLIAVISFKCAVTAIFLC